jgi:SAM-dependent methyltransferase
MQNTRNTHYSGIDLILNIEVMENYNTDIVASAMNYLGGARQVIDFGAGIGTLSVIFRDKFEVTPLCVEIDQANTDYLEKRRLPHVQDLASAPNADLIFSSNVLEHIEDDVATLRLMNDKLTATGRLYLYLPAKQILWTQLDDAVGHYRRYDIQDLKQKCRQAGLNVIRIHYADSVGFFASLFMKVVGYNVADGIGSEKSLRFYDRMLFPISRFFDHLGLRFFFGKNIVLVAEKAPA